MRTRSRWKIRAVAAAYALVTALVVDPSPNMTYRLVSHYSGGCLDQFLADQERDFVGVEACQVDGDGYPALGQLWFLANNLIQNFGSADCIARSADGGGVYTETVACRPRDRAQQWERVPAPDGRGTMFRNVDSGNYLAFIGGREAFVLSDRPGDNGTRWDVVEFCEYGIRVDC